tara:strand:- start:10590 stop:11264 length:675 start_codon:yes stop_codon:yes gene_type:complete
MIMAKISKNADDMQPENTLTVERSPDETSAQAVARMVLEPHMRHAVSASSFAGKALGKDFEGPGLMDYFDHVQALTAKAEAGDLTIVSRMLAAQAVTLDSMFTELARRAALNMGEYFDAAERYGRLALKAQSNSRATLEALAKLHQPREQIVRHVHVNEGGQAVVADQFHQHTGGAENGKSVKQSDATGKAGECAALPSPDSQGNGLPVPSNERAQAMQDARRD